MPIAFRKRRYPIVTPNQALVRLEDGIWHPVYGHNRFSVSLGTQMFVFEDKSSIVGVTEPDFITLHDSTSEDQAYELVCAYNITDLTEKWK